MGIDNPLFALLTAAPILYLYWIFLKWVEQRRTHKVRTAHLRNGHWSPAHMAGVYEHATTIIDQIRGPKMEDPDHAHMGEVKPRPECEHEWTKTEDGHVDPYGHCTKCQLLTIYRSSVEFL